MRVLTANQMRQLDAHMIKNNAIPGIVLMENAANGIFEICQTLANKDESVIHVFCGVGNNGGDGFATARILLSNGFSVKVYLVGSVSQLKGDAKTNADFFIQNNQINVIDSDHLDFKFSKHDVIIDALFGIGLSRNIEGVFKSVIAAINDAACPKIAVDVPSGLNADSGAVMGIAVHATHTVTFQRPKPAHFLQPGKSYCGKISIVKIGIEDGFAFDGDVSASSRTLAPLKLEKRNPNSHKGTYGTLGLLVSSKDMPGAGLMCATAALKSGVGLLHLFVPQSKKVMFSTAFPEAIVRTQADFLNEDFPLTAVACGPGLSKDDLAVKLVKKAISDYTSLPKVFDADALNIISEQSDLLTQLNEKTVVTPHPLEFSRLGGLSVDAILSDPISATQDFAQKHHCTVILKLATSVACSPTGSVRLVDAGTPGMARGGSGDVLTGIVGAFLAQGFSSLDAAEYSAYIAGTAGEMAAQEKGEYSMSPLDTIDMIAKTIMGLS